jgi:hypothetical protein
MSALPHARSASYHHVLALPSSPAVHPPGRQEPSWGPCGLRAVQGTVAAAALVPGRPAQQAKGARGPAVKLTSYPGTVRQLSVTGLGREARTVIITNGNDITTKALTGQYARRMTIEQRLAEIIQGFCADAVQRRQPQRRPVRRPRPSPPRSGCACPATTAMPPPTPSRAASSKPPARSSPTQPASPSRSTAAPAHPSSATPISPGHHRPRWNGRRLHFEFA